jgi:hypothetical protein
MAISNPLVTLEMRYRAIKSKPDRLEAAYVATPGSSILGLWTGSAYGLDAKLYIKMGIPAGFR